MHLNKIQFRFVIAASTLLLLSSAMLLAARLRIIVTNLELPSRAVVRFYNKRSTVEQWI